MGCAKIILMTGLWPQLYANTVVTKRTISRNKFNPSVHMFHPSVQSVALSAPPRPSISSEKIRVCPSRPYRSPRLSIHVRPCLPTFVPSVNVRPVRSVQPLPSTPNHPQLSPAPRLSTSGTVRSRPSRPSVLSVHVHASSSSVCPSELTYKSLKIKNAKIIQVALLAASYQDQSLGHDKDHPQEPKPSAQKNKGKGSQHDCKRRQVKRQYDCKYRN